MGYQSPVQGWLADDESFFSLCSRIHRASGHRRSDVTCSMLFGHPLLGRQHDFPARLGHFAHVTEGRFGDALQLLLRTLYPYFLAWKPREIAEDLMPRICDDVGGDAWRFRIRTAICGFASDHALKLCPDCVAEEHRRFGVSYWKLPHQYPGVWMCSVHGRLLWIQRRVRERAGGLSWTLPTLETAVPVGQNINEADLAALADFSAFCVAAMSRPQLSAELRVQEIRLAFDTLRLSPEWRPRKRLEDAGRAYVAHVAPFRLAPDMRALPSESCLATTWLWILRFGAWQRLHPLILLSVAHWLSTGLDEYADG